MADVEVKGLSLLRCAAFAAAAASAVIADADVNSIIKVQAML